MAKGETYEQFVDKFKQKKTTDDCYTPANIMQAVEDYVERRYNVSRETFIRPFWPGGDYKAEDYAGRVVVDNPPFSIQREIYRFYQANGVPFFLFCNGLTGIGSCKVPGVTFIATSADITYENGAKVRTGFATNMEPDVAARTAVDLSEALKACAPNKSRGSVPHPANVWTSSRLMTACNHGRDVVIPAADCEFVTKSEAGCIYGGGLLYEKLDAEAH